MKIVGMTVLVLFALIGAVVTGAFALAHFENSTSFFQTYDELKASGLIERGWVSEHLPRSATEIKESHDIDTNRGWTSFKYRAGDASVADAHCRLLHKTNQGAMYLCPPHEQSTFILVLLADGTGHVELHWNEI